MFSSILRIFKRKIDGKTAEEWLNEGVALHNQGRYDEAIVCFDKSLTVKEDPGVRRIREEVEGKRVRKLMDDAKKTILQIKSKYNIKEAEDILSRAEEAFKKGEYSKAEKLASRAKKNAVEIGKQVEEVEKSEKAIETTKKAILQIKSKYNIKEAEDILSRAEEAFKKGEYSKAEKLALKAKEKAVEIGKQVEEVEKVIDNAKKAIYQIKSKYNIKEAEGILSQAEEVFKKRDYSKARELALKAKEKAVEIGKRAEEVEKVIEDAKKTISQIKSKYNVGEIGSLLYQAEEVFKKGEYSKAEKLALKAKKNAVEIGKQAEEVEKVIDNAKKTISQIKSKYNIKEAEDILSWAEEAFKKGEYSKIDEIVLMAKEKAIEIGKQAEEVKKAIGDAKKVISRIKSKYNIKEAEDILFQAEEAFNRGDYSKAEKLASRAKEKAISIINYFTMWKYDINDSILLASVTPDGEYVVAGSKDKNVYLFNKEGELLWKYKTGDEVHSVSITPDGEYVVAGSKNKNVCLINRKGRLLWKYKTDGSVYSVSITPDGEYVVAAVGGNHSYRYHKYYYGNYYFGNVYLFNRKGRLLWIRRTGNYVYSVSITPDGEYVVAGGADKNVYLFNREEGLLWKYETEGSFISVSITPDGEYVVAGGADKNVYLFNKEGKLLWKYGTDGSVYSVSITPDGEYIVTRSGSKVCLFNKEGKLLWKYESDYIVNAVSITPDGEYVVAGSDDNNVYLFNREEGLLWKYKTDDWVYSVSITPDGEYIVAGDKDGNIYHFASLQTIPKIIEELESKLRFISDSNKLLEPARKEFKEGNYENALQYINKCKELIENAKPKLKIKLLNTSFTYNKWEKVGLEVVNEGDSIAKNTTFEFSDDVTVRSLPKIRVNPKSKKRMDFNLKPNAFGETPVKVEIRCKDHLNREYKFRKTVMLKVKEMVGETTPETPKKEISSAEFTPKITTPKTLPPELSEKYLEVEFIGKGGFARVFKAKRKDGKEVAIKIPISLDESTGKSFLKEIENWTNLNHKNIVKVYHYNILPIPYFEMELCDHSLADLKKPLDPEKAAWIIFHTAEGLKYTHSQKIIHRDLKPHNILLKEGIPKISDWGLSKVMTESSSATADKGFTPLYASPEQVKGESKDKRTDIWQIGVVFYELITGELPFNGDNLVEIGMAIATKNPVKPSEINPETKEVEKIIMKCLEKDKTKRYQSVKELQRDLSEYLGIKYKESLKLSVSRKDFKRSAYYCCELLLINMKINNMIDAYKYISDLLNYTDSEVKQEVQKLHEHLEYRIENGIEDIPEELIKVAEVIAHRVRVGF